MKNKEDIKMIKEAAQSIGIYSKRQAEILSELVASSIDNKAYVSVSTMSKEMNIHRPTIYSSIDKLLIDGIIEKDSNQKGFYKINQDKIDFILSTYKKKQGMD